MKPKKANKEIMRSYRFADLKKEGTVKLSLGNIVALKGLAIKYRFDELAEKLRTAENKILKQN